MRRIILILLGWLAVALASAGAILPLLPTTPFLLLAAWCFARSSPRFHHWLLYRSWFGSYLRAWQQHRALPAGAKVRIVLVVIGTCGFSLWWLENHWLQGGLAAGMLLLLLMVWRLPVIDPTQQKP